MAKRIFRKNLQAIALAMLAALILGLILSAYLLQRNLRAEALYKSDTLASNMADAMIANDMRQLQSLLLNATNTPDMQTANVYDSHGQPILAWNPQGQLIKTSGVEATTLLRRHVVEYHLGNFSAISPVLSGTTVIGQVQLQISTWPLYQHILLFLLIAGFLFVFTTVLAAYWLTNNQLRSMQPIMELSVIAEKVATLGDYSLRAPQDPEHELGSLNMHFNLMLARMEAWENDMQSEAKERREADSRLAILNNHDSLTKLPNRHYFHRLLSNCLEDAVANEEMAALMFIDLDHFKGLSESFGYDAGDLILATMANRLCGVLRSTDTLCRVDGDEFAAIMPNVGSLEVVEQLADRLVKAINQPMTLRGQQILLSASVGVACCPLHAKEQRLFLHHADIALKAAKAAGRNTWRLYSKDLPKTSQAVQLSI
ncbi:chemotaxis protein CheR [Undibacterium sp. YM2]|uniref:sensor domain-containing diguanylate cyclase n=1 Tax=Undibacterium sp. YM2 TaxID=2058625 RepID=UPI001331F4B7|nr:sensor domain-containing diguanylate cyclase [Undibacterium sp. YM2]BBB69467.1 chemotaxis protein CheR [Undibacterium sp. YM2]